jgi:hypothetical protein
MRTEKFLYCFGSYQCRPRPGSVAVFVLVIAPSCSVNEPPPACFQLSNDAWLPSKMFVNPVSGSACVRQSGASAGGATSPGSIRNQSNFASTSGLAASVPLRAMRPTCGFWIPVMACVLPTLVQVSPSAER